MEEKHRSQCGVCQHAEKAEIERLWRSGRSGRSLSDEFGLHHSTVTLHANYFGIKLDLEKALEAILASGIDGLKAKGATAAHAVEAAKSMAKLRGLWVDRTELMPPGWADKSEAEIAFFADHGRFPQDGEIEAIH